MNDKDFTDEALISVVQGRAWRLVMNSRPRVRFANRTNGIVFIENSSDLVKLIGMTMTLWRDEEVTFLQVMEGLSWLQIFYRLPDRPPMSTTDNNSLFIGSVALVECIMYLPPLEV